jgi:hypothetical protein
LGFSRVVCMQTSSQYPRLVTPVRLVKCPPDSPAGTKKSKDEAAKQSSLSSV